MVGVVMSPPTPDSPRGPDDLRRLANDLRRDVAWLRAEVHAKALMIEKLRAQLAVLRRARFGRSSEKLETQVERLELLIDELEEGAAETFARASVAESDAAEVDRDRRVVVEEAQAFHPRSLARPSAGGDDRPRSAVRVPDLRRRQVRPDRRRRARGARIRSLPLQARRARAAEDELPSLRAIVQAPMPTLPIEKGRPGPALLAHVVVSKFCDHLPLHRQADIYARQSVQIDRSVMAGWSAVSPDFSNP